MKNWGVDEYDSIADGNGSILFTASEYACGGREIVETQLAVSVIEDHDNYWECEVRVVKSDKYAEGFTAYFELDKDTDANELEDIATSAFYRY